MRSSIIAAALLSSFAATAETPEDYSFISGDDLYDALSQESMILQGYALGVVDATKHSEVDSDCFVIPLRPDADQVIYSSYLNYWAERLPRPVSAVAAITEMMRAEHPCSNENLNEYD